MLVEFTLLPSGYSDEVLDVTDPLASAARRYKVTLNPKKLSKAKAKCTPKTTKQTTKGKVTAKRDKRGTAEATAKGGAA